MFSFLRLNKKEKGDLENKLDFLESIKKSNGFNEQYLPSLERLNQCGHDSCPKCEWNGKDQMGRLCVHHLHCWCVKCSPIY